MKICGTNNEIFSRVLRKNHCWILCYSTSKFDGDVILQKALNHAVN